MRTVKTEFPDYDGVLPVIAGYEDTSWHNDACPSIEKDYYNGVRVRIWCDYVDPEKREMPHYQQYSVVVYSPTDEEGSDLFSTNWIHVLIERVGQFEASMTIPPLELAKAFCRQLHKELDDGTMKIVNRRNAEYEACGDNSSCATHEFCDANQVMLDAIESICGFADYHFAQNEMINAAWDIARKARFDADKCEQAASDTLDELEASGVDTGLGGPLSDLRDELSDSLLTLVYENTLTPRDSGYGELMVYTNSDTANAAVVELAKIGVFVQTVPLLPISRFRSVPIGTDPS